MYCSKHYQQIRRYGRPITSNRDRRRSIIEGDIAKIPLGLNAKDEYAIIDKQYAYLGEDNWRKTYYGYAIRSKDKQKLHSVIMVNNKNRVVDHIDGDPLNNRITNLRLCTQAENSRNSPLCKSNTSGYKGVSWAKNTQKWQASITYQYKKISLGGYFSPVEAAKAYNVKAKDLFGEFARLNDV